ncbi:hypothetical protein BH23ACT5_BH23ACT5_04150 [soil metagenome]
MESVSFGGGVKRLASGWTHRLLVGVTVLVALATAVAFLVPDLAADLGIIVMFVGYTLAGLTFVLRARAHQGNERLAWSLLGVGLLVGAAGVMAFIVATLSGFDPPAFGPLDLFFIGAYSFCLAGVWVLPHLEGALYRRMRVMLDGLVGAVSVGLIAWVWVLQDILVAVRDAPVWELVIGSIYPIFDVAILIAVMVVTLRRTTLRFDPRMLVFGLGVSAQAAADLFYFNQGIGASFLDSEPFFPAYMLAATCFLIAGLLLDRRPAPREYAERRTPWWAMVAPYSAALLLIGMLVFRVTTAPATDLATLELLAGVVVVVSLIMMRQAVAIRENRELVESQREALVSSISHELRTPLTAIVGFLDILRDPAQHMEVESRREMLGIVDQQATYMARIVSDLVMLNRSDPDLRVQERLVDVDGVVSSALASLDHDAAPGVSVEVDDGLVGLFDPARIHQVLVNLLTNAARYGGPNRLVVARRHNDDLVFEVHDDGGGVPKRYELMIWDRFERGAHRYDAGLPGSGIGLALVSMLARAHQGSATYRTSERLGGACFVVTLPDRAHHRDATPVPASPEIEEVSIPAAARGRLINNGWQ